MWMLSKTVILHKYKTHSFCGLQVPVSLFLSLEFHLGEAEQTKLVVILAPTKEQS